MDDLTIQYSPTPCVRESGKAPDKRSGPGFYDFIKGAVKNLNDMEAKADQSVEQLMKGKAGIHETMIALQKADISLRFFLQVRNKAMDAYREIMRMPF
ncbi:MAG: flagellar hook-basal body complex protein FliE [Deltaproteobacteria bacterium]|nr:flagellar hook-basal body complex protein FliE [Deltaproteobacteria bacterium]